MDATEFERRAALVDARYETPAASDVPGREAYGWIDFEGLPNTRDLGGLIGADGRRVKPGRLLRSGALGFARGRDLDRLREDYDLRLVVDLRNSDELAELPDPMDAFPGARFVHADILASEALGITQEQSAREEMERLRRELEAASDPIESMAILYPHMLLDDQGRKGYRAFFQALLACEEGAALWHCYVGRDRCGLASALVETALGVDRAEIERDYLATNVYAPRELTEGGAASLRSLHAALGAVEDAYGGVMGYITEALGVTASDITDLRARYLEARAVPSGARMAPMG